MTPANYQLIYTSEVSETFKDADIAAILETARHNNERLDVTGMLLYSAGRFIQVLEGDKTTVGTLYDTIQRDTRHENARRVMARDIAQREFSEWSMAFRTVSDHDLLQHPLILDFFNESFDAKAFTQYASPAHFLLLAFRDTA